MIVSKSKKFIFLKTRKCGGSSIQNTLQVLCKPGDLVSTGEHTRQSVLPNCGSSLDEFATLDNVVKALDIDLNEYFKFGFARNPFSMTLSRYLYQIKMKRVQEIPSKENFNKWAKNSYFVLEGQFKYTGDGTRHMLFNKEGKQIVDFIGKLENVDTDFEYIKEKLNLPKNLKATKDNVSNPNKINYKDWMNEETKLLVEKHFAFELERLNYEY
tara:strand:+ start:730 stop:1368 length:639 start_codon:yes stop_codon:yes gene_type:complete